MIYWDAIGRTTQRPEVTSLRTEVISDEDRLEGLREDWDRLWLHSPTTEVFSSFGWVRAWWKHFGREERYGGAKKLHVVAIRSEERVEGLAPLLLRRAKRGGIGIRKVEWIGGMYGDAATLLCQQPNREVLRALVRHLEEEKGSWDLADLRQTPAQLVPLFTETLDNSCLLYRQRPEAECRYIPIDSDWEGFLKKQSRRFRRTLRLLMNRQRELRGNGLRVRMVEDPWTEPSLLDRLAEVELQKRIRGAPTLKVLSTERSFFEDLFRDLPPEARIYVALMEKGRELIAYELGFRFRDRLLAYLKAYRHDYARYSPGTMLLPEILDYGFRKSCREYSFGRGNQPYKNLWAKATKRNGRLMIWHSNARSRLSATVYFRLRPPVDRLLSRLRLRYSPEE